MGDGDKSMRRKVWTWAWLPLLVLVCLLLAAWIGFPESEIIDDLPRSLEWIPKVQPIAPYIIIPILLFFFWHAAIAFDRAKGPIIWIDDIVLAREHALSRQYSIAFDTRVRNAGDNEVDAFLYVTCSRSVKGKTIGGLDSQINWHGEEVPLTPLRLFGHKYGIATVFSLIKTDAAKNEFQIHPGPGHALKDKEEVVLTLRVDFHEAGSTVEVIKETLMENSYRERHVLKKTKFIKSKTVTISVTYDPSLPELCRIKRR